MKLSTTPQEFDQLPIYNRLFLAMWKLKKGYAPVKECTFAEVLELAFALTNDLHYDATVRDGPDEAAMFNNVLDYQEFLLAFDGDDPLGILWYKLNEKLRRRINQYIVAHA